MTDIRLSRDEFNTLAIASVRYTLGRQTGLVHTVIETIEARIDHLDAGTRQVIVIDIKDAYAKASLGDPKIDAPAWLRLLHKLEGTST